MVLIFHVSSWHPKIKWFALITRMSRTQMVGARVTLEIVEEITEAVEAGFYLTPSHLIRNAIEQELGRLKGEEK